MSVKACVQQFQPNLGEHIEISSNVAKTTTFFKNLFITAYIYF